MNSFINKIGIDAPVVQAGMAGGITTPELVAAVANAGGLGTLGAGYMSDKVLKADIQAIKQLTDKPFAVNLFAVNLEAFSDDIAQMQQFLNQYRGELEMDTGESSIKVRDYLQEKIDVILEENIPIVSTAFGVLSYMLIDRLKANDVKLIGMATNLEEAKQLEEAGFDAVVAQGMEAGGHRSTFNVEKYPDGCQIGLHVLVQELLDHTNLAIIAAGGIHTKSQADALMTMGTSAVQLGTRFLLAEEAGTNAAYRRALIKAETNDTVITKVFSGHPARAIRNRLVEEVEASGIAPLPFPIQNQMTKDIRSAGKEFAMPEVQSLWAGQGVGAIEKEESAADIVASLI
ncbi:NAD(P)H-dependent flavin oxidoreductase [Lentibacillus amyloliquefaciens]|uniref:Probable nitronate monooxygenase n=1 Tax=Lentibacillus amyloliquefaciens TaxID=1472767 RepID=A0A0U3W9P2_9BACI|nr:nitronate monooxygenase [Lentibacillus amyloliquefaciens]ALX49778.1 2-nitropropane dioxygenase [Lentibacillus amyloliquefaciens]